MFSDEYFEKESNQKIFEFLTKLFFSKEVVFDKKPAQVDNEYVYAPDVAELSEKLKGCLQESEELPKDPTTLFDVNLFRFDVDMIPEAIKLFE